MTKYEYKEVSFSANRDDIEELLNPLGAEGWHVVGIRHSLGYVYYLLERATLLDSREIPTIPRRIRHHD